jgi:hypothetical protein
MKWRGWAAIGAILMMVAGAFQIISGIFGLFNDQWIVLGYDGYFVVDVTGLAVWMIVVGAILLLGGIAVVQGSTIGRIVGVVAASLAIISQLFMLPVHPIWSIVLILLYVLALIGFIVMRDPLEATEEELTAPVAAASVTQAVETPVAPAAPASDSPAPAAPVEAAPAAPVDQSPAPPVEQ